jgi:hypothetical protein
MDYNAYRERIYRWLHSCLIGPDTRAGFAPNSTNLYHIKPLERYQTGILFPIVKGEDGLDPAAEETEDLDDPSDLQGDQDGAQPTASSASQPKRRFVPPSSVGLSFFVHGKDIRLQLIPCAVRYEPLNDRTRAGRADDWQRVQLGADDSEACDRAAPNGGTAKIWREPVFDQRGELFVLWRPLAAGWLVTASLSNTQDLPQIQDYVRSAAERNERTLFEAELKCVIDAGEVGPYPGVQYDLLSDEEQELELQYRRHRVYAIGHGAAVDWQIDQGRVVAVRTEFLPRVEVPQVSAEVGVADRDVLRIRWLAEIDTDPTGRCEALHRFVAGYAAWVRETSAQVGGLAGAEQGAAKRIHGRMETAVARMGEGIRLLHREPMTARAFALANRAMEAQMAQADKAANMPDHRWRPFQLAFLLLTIESAINEDSGFRDTLDLIWFPTGGGKTEAYLGLMAFLICWRRLNFGATGGGTSVLMRYTLRLLTKDQFRRAARLICALELLRRETPDLGKEAITLGLWVGGASSPNTFSEAKEARDQAVEDGARPPSLLVLETCPWCDQPFAANQNYDAGKKHFHFNCAHPGCDFGRQAPGILPCNVVDAALYESPPTLLLATVDKFARLAWEERAGAFFGRDGNRPPELIIQDELHLIASALGSVAGLYEAGIETVLTLRGVHPKYIASTATIRMAAEQVERLYGRTAAIFPPPGLDCEDSYFARSVPLSERPGRLYFGYLTPARDRAHCLAPLAAALLAAPEVLFADAGADAPALLDAWWTLLVYHGSLKGVGISRNALQDIETFMARYQAEFIEQQRQARGDGADPADVAENPWQRRAQLAQRLTQLTSHMSADDNARTFERLKLSQTDRSGLDLVLATNMVSVGLDVARLAVMVVNGQPLTTAEYIQASSRVGRGEVPGIVVANYYRDQARSLSHYESFRAYHESFYRYVEPTSVTPYTYQARLRALHAALIIAVRHTYARLAANESAGDFVPADPAIAHLIEALKLRCRRADQGRGTDTANHIDALVAQWADAARRALDSERLVYHGGDGDRRDQRLIHSHEAKVKGLWATLNSMRNVENTALVKVL